MMNRKQIARSFGLDADGEPVFDAFGHLVDSACIIERLFGLQLAGRSHGRAGYYPEGDYSSDADWVNGPGVEIQRLSDLLDIDDDSVGQLYSDAHDRYFRDGTINPEERSWAPDIYELSFGAYSDLCISVHAKGPESALEAAAEHLAKVAPGLFVEPDYDDAAREIGVDLSKYTNGLADIYERDKQLAERITDRAEADLTYTESGWLASWEWTIDGPR